MKFLPGPVIAAASGSVGGTVFSHNAGGMYTRNRSIPTVSTTAAAMAAKARLGGQSVAWKALTDAQRLTWKQWAAANPRINTLGASHILPANAAYIGLATRMVLIGESPAVAPPTIPAPNPLSTLTGTFDIGVGAFELAFLPTPLGATEKLFIRATVQNSDSINYVNNLLRYVGVSAAAQATGYDASAQIEAVFGTLLVGQIVTMFVSVISDASGQLSPPLRVEGTVVTT